MKKQKIAVLLFALVLMIIGACLMIDGNILGPRTVPAAIVTTLTGLTLITSIRKPERRYIRGQ